MSSLFEKYGGFATLGSLTKLFYQKLLDSLQVAHYFAQTDITLLIEHQTNFLVSALGGSKLTQDITTTLTLIQTNKDQIVSVWAKGR